MKSEKCDNYFEKLASISVKEQSVKKGKFTYLSWAWAVDILRRNDPTATWEIIRFNGLPFLQTECGYFVEVAVAVRGLTLSQLHPVLDNYNKTIPKPNSFQINTSIQRALVKAIALHGIGLYIYAGEDLPESEELKEKEAEETITSEQGIKIEKLAKLAGLTNDDIKKVYKLNSLIDLPISKYGDAISRLEKKIQKEVKGANDNA